MGGQRKSAGDTGDAADAEPVLEVSPWSPAAPSRRDPASPETQRPPAASPPASTEASALGSLVLELNSSLGRLRQRFHEVTAVVEGLGGLRSLGGEDALIEMAMFAQSHEHTLESAWAALLDCEQLARRLAQPSGSAPPPGEGPVSSAPMVTERTAAAALEHEPAATPPAPPAAPVVEGVRGAATGELTRATKPAPLEGPTKPAPPLPEDEEGPVTQVDIAPPRVLLVDDDPAVLRAFRRVLATDHEVVTARDGAEALRVVLGGAQVDAIICDIGMPKLDGPAFFSELFELRPQMMPRVVFCTGGQPNEKTQRFLERLQAPLLYKPVAVDELRQAIASVRSR
jgi:CheY-like chemotaxis protein